MIQHLHISYHVYRLSCNALVTLGLVGVVHWICGGLQYEIFPFQIAVMMKNFGR